MDFINSKDARKTYKANLCASFFGYFINTVSRFLFRGIFLRFLSRETLGLTGMFGSVLGVVSVAELGISGAILQTFFNPIAKGDVKELSCAYYFLKKVSMLFAGIIFALCVLVSGNLHFFVNSLPDIPDIKQLFLLFCAGAVVPYFYAAERSLVMCCRRQYVISYAGGLFNVLSTVVQIVLLVAGKGIKECLLINMAVSVTEGIFYGIYVKKHFPPLEKNAKPQKSYIAKVTRNFKGLVFHKLGGICYSNTDNLLTSKMLGLGYTALYSNYALVIGTINTVPALILDALTAEVGNIVFTKPTEQTERIFDSIYFANLLTNTLCSSLLISCINPFVTFWLGEDAVLPDICVTFIVIYYFFAGLRDVPLLFRTSYGLFYEERKKPVVQALLNLCLMPPFIKLMGFSGVFVSQLATILSCCVFYEPYILYKYGFCKDFKAFLHNNTGKMFFSLICIFTSKKIGCFVFALNFNIGIKLVLCTFAVVFFVCLSFYLCYINTPQGKFILNFLFKKAKAGIEQQHS